MNDITTEVAGGNVRGSSGFGLLLLIRKSILFFAAPLILVLNPGCSGSGGATAFPSEFRTIDGSGNNIANPNWGSADIPLLRLSTAEYADGVGTPTGAARPSARLISNLCAASPGPTPNSMDITSFFWQWGQFVDHDIDLTPVIDPPEPLDILVPMGDPFFDPFSTGTETIPLDRSFYEMIGGLRQQTNNITSYIDASNVYGSDAVRAAALRMLDGTGRLKTSAGDLPPFNDSGLPNAPDTMASFFLVGDFRGNEQVALTAMHALFVREHNYWADEIRTANPLLDGETIYQRARAIVAAEMQWITFNEFLPLLLGPGAIPPYAGYDPGVDATIANIFSTSAYRFGHTMLPTELMRLDANLMPIADGHLSLKDGFFSPLEISNVGLEPYLRGLAQQIAEEVDTFVVDDIRNFLFGPPGSGGFDLASLNIQRGRDHGLPDYNQARVDFGLPPVADFIGVSSDVPTQQKLATAYGTVADMDLWVAGLAEDHVPSSMVGETFQTIIREQFLALRDGDRFWYENYLPANWQATVESQTLATIIRRNTTIGAELQDNVFLASAP